MSSVLVWDWNGTLLDDVHACVAAINSLLKRRDLEPMTHARYHRIFAFPVRRYYEAMGFDFERESFAEVADEYHAAYDAVVEDTELRGDAIAALERARRVGLRQVVLSALEERRLESELSRRGIRHYFEAVYGLGDLYAASKVDRGRQMVQDLDAPRGCSWMIGDTDHDVEVARAIGLEPITVLGGHHPRARLESLGAPVVGSLVEALDLIRVEDGPVPCRS